MYVDACVGFLATNLAAQERAMPRTVFATAKIHMIEKARRYRSDGDEALINSGRLASIIASVFVAVLASGLAACAVPEQKDTRTPSLYGSPGVGPGPDFFDPRFYGGIGI
jgi:hypothetical protein